MKDILKHIKSEIVGQCECCDDPVYAPADELAREIFAYLPLKSMMPLDIQSHYNKVIEMIENSYGLVLEMHEDVRSNDNAKVH